MGIFSFLFGRKDVTGSTQRIAQSGPSRNRADIDWPSGTFHLSLLSRFLFARDVSSITKYEMDDAVKESTQRALEGFIAEGWLIPASLSAKLSQTFGATTIRALLKERGLPVSGSKGEGIERLIAADSDGMAAKVVHLKFYECSPKARELVAPLVSAEQEKWQAVKEQRKKLLQENEDAERAILREKFGQEPSDGDVKWSILAKESLAHAKANNWGLYTNSEMYKADFLMKEGRLKDALEHYLWVCHLDLNEPNNYGKLDKELRKEYPPFGPDLGILAPVITENVRDISNDLNLDTEALRVFYFKQVGKRAKGMANILPRSIDETWGLLTKNLAE
jgi:hypothetical protein